MNLTLYKKETSSMTMERRSSNRIETNFKARFFYGNFFYSGTITNVSDSGMFINTKRFLPTDSMFVVIIRLENVLLKVIAKVQRLTATEDNGAGIGVTLVSPSHNYLEFIHSIKTS